jgi:YD repeat-containing protein
VQRVTPNRLEVSQRTRDMALLSITDAEGTTWMVYDVQGEASARFVSGPLREGWLVFQTEHERRRLAPIPHGWDRLPEHALLALCSQAAPVPPIPRGKWI